MSKTGDDTARNLKRYLESEHSVVEPIIPSKDKQEKPSVKKDEPPSWKDKKNDDNNEYEYSDNKDEDDRDW